MVYNTLNSYWLWKELATFLKVSNPTYKYWKDTQSFKLNNKYVFLQKNTLPQKYEYAQNYLTDLSGYLPIKYASDRLNIDSHTFTYNHSRNKKSTANIPKDLSRPIRSNSTTPPPIAKIKIKQTE